MALAPHPPARLPTAPIDAEKAFLDAMAEVERVVDVWLAHKDRSQPHAVALPRAPILDAAGEAEIVRRYLAAGWSKAEIDKGVLHLTPALPEP